jgi:argininosuccinate synthase
MTGKRIVLAYSGGLDTSVAIPWLQEKYQAEIITLTVNLGNLPEMESIQDKALKTGAISAITVDVTQEFLEHYAFPSLQANATYEGQYYLATALGRPLIAKHLIKLAQEEGAFAIAHGCTGKGNDQVRFETSAVILDPDITVLAPAREWNMTRPEEVDYAMQRGISVPSGTNPYSTDENIWGRSIESGILEDPWIKPPDDVYLWTQSIPATPETPTEIEITFQSGVPVAVNDEHLSAVPLVTLLNTLAGTHGIGRVDHIENRLVGIKSREIYEAPAATILHAAHQALETMTLGKQQQRFKERVAQEYADLIYNGLWFTPLRSDLQAFVNSTQKHVTGTIRLSLNKGTAVVTGRKADKSLYSFNLATYDKDDVFDHTAATGFINLYSLPFKTQAAIQDDLADSQ